MSKRTPGGRAKKAQKDRRRTFVPAQPPATEQEGAVPSSAPETRRPVVTTASRPRESLLASVRRPARASAAGLSTDYRYVISDLRRIALVAAAAFAVLIGLTFVIR